MGQDTRTPGEKIAAANRERQARAEAARESAEAAASTWPERGSCCWPTNDGRPWQFCGAPAAEESASGYCARHHAATKPSSQRPSGSLEAADFTLPKVTGNRVASGARAALNGAKSAQARARGKPV